MDGWMYGRMGVDETSFVSSRSMSVTWWYALWPNLRSRSWMSESCKNGLFQTVSLLPVCNQKTNIQLWYSKTIPKFFLCRFLTLVWLHNHMTFKLLPSSNDDISGTETSCLILEFGFQAGWMALFLVWSNPRCCPWHDVTWLDLIEDVDKSQAISLFPN